MKHLFLIFAVISSPLASLAGTCEEDHPGATPEVIQVCRQERDRAQNSQSDDQGRSQQQQQGNNSNIPYSDCQRLYSRARSGIESPQGVRLYYENGQALPQIPAPATGANGIPGISRSLNEELRFCKGLEYASPRLGAELVATGQRVSQDRKIQCVQKSGITTDWESCVSALGMYNSILVAEAAMQVFQGVQTNKVQNQAENQFAQRAAVGDAQNAAYDAQKANLDNAKELNQQQAAAYAAAVAALYSKIQTWVKEDKTTFIQKGCGRVQNNTPANNSSKFQPPSSEMLFKDVDSVPGQENCVQAAGRAFDQYRSIAYANREAKAAFTTAAMMFAAKAIQAGIAAKQLGSIAQKLEEAKKTTEDPYNPAMFEICAVNSNDPRCGTATRTPGSGLQDGGFSFGDSFGSYAGGGLGDEEQLGNDPLAPLAGDNTVADVSNPFSDDAKKASGILDPAAAASMSPGQAGGGGGGGGGGLGGGSASLSDDVPGLDESKKESDIKANKGDGRYSDASSGGFQAIKPMKEENPFANLFGGPGGGKLEEDRSIASGDIDGKDSGLFAKISKRYGQVQADKRIEAKNLEE